MTKFSGYLDRLRENVETLDEAIENARVMSKKKGKESNALQWTKTLRDLVELRNATLANIKVHLLGRDETGATNEPPDYYRRNEQVCFERDFQNFLGPWTRQDLKLKCEDCGIESEDVCNRHFSHPYADPRNDEDVNFCPECLEKRQAKESETTQH